MHEIEKKKQTNSTDIRYRCARLWNLFNNILPKCFGPRPFRMLFLFSGWKLKIFHHVLSWHRCARTRSHLNYRFDLFWKAFSDDARINNIFCAYVRVCLCMHGLRNKNLLTYWKYKKRNIITTTAVVCPSPSAHPWCNSNCMNAIQTNHVISCKMNAWCFIIYSKLFILYAHQDIFIFRKCAPSKESRQTHVTNFKWNM